MKIVLQSAEPQWVEGLIGQKNSLEGQILMDQNRYEEALSFLKKSYNIFSEINNNFRATIPWEALHLANCYFQLGDLDEALMYGHIALEQQDLNGENARRLNRKIQLVLYEIYNGLGEELQAFKHLKYYHDLVEKTKLKDYANLLMEAEVRAVLEKSQIEITRLEQERILKEQQNKTQRLWIFSIAGALLSALLLAFILYRNNKIKQKANARLKEQKEEIQATLEQLEATQKQLIQSEKMASLGELTAGIAHEIQNPLNFVTNFSEVSEELIIELKEEIENNSKKDIEEILENINQNLGKINHHGKRASSIVKGMLDHSRSSKGVKILTDINLLADEYLRLSYHGLRAKDKSFNAGFITEFDSSIPKISIVPQDFGRVILNLINNAFYSVNKKAKEVKEGYRPMVTVGTKKMEGEIKISIKDNGEGISKEIIDKIFQPFFTTKPTGEGTGLGLSLAYDIVSKGYGGKLIAESKKGSYTEFSILLPLKNKE
jgi:signal transduction histidine kinase